MYVFIYLPNNGNFRQICAGYGGTEEFSSNPN